jgi:HIT domain
MVFEDDLTVALLDIVPINPGHTLVVSCRPAARRESFHNRENEECNRGDDERLDPASEWKIGPAPDARLRRLKSFAAFPRELHIRESCTNRDGKYDAS